MEKSHKIDERDAADSLIAREITQEILQFGVSQYQIKKVIEFLAFELEDTTLMRNILSLVRDDNLEEEKNLEF